MKLTGSERKAARNKPKWCAEHRTTDCDACARIAEQTRHDVAAAVARHAVLDADEGLEPSDPATKFGEQARQVAVQVARHAEIEPCPKHPQLMAGECLACEGNGTWEAPIDPAMKFSERAAQLAVHVEGDK